MAAPGCSYSTAWLSDLTRGRTVLEQQSIDVNGWTHVTHGGGVTSGSIFWTSSLHHSFAAVIIHLEALLNYCSCFFTKLD